MRGKYLLGLDYGTLSLRTVLVDSVGKTMVAFKEMRYPHGVMDCFLPDGDTKLDINWALQYPMDYLTVMEETVRGLLEDNVICKEDVIGISLDFTSCTALPVDQEKIPLCYKEKYIHRPHAYVKLWKHHGAQAEANYINDVLEGLGVINEPRYGGKISSELLLPKALEILNHDPEIYDEMYAFMEAGDWLTWVLTDSNMRSGNMAAYKAMWLPEVGYPTSDVLKKIHPKLEKFVEEKLQGEICPVGYKIGELNKEWADRLGLMEGTAVGASVIDSHCGLPGSGVHNLGQMMLVLGTSSVQLLLAKKEYSSEGIVGAVKGGIIPGYYTLESGLAAVGDMFAWLIDNYVPYSYAKEAEEKDISIHQLLCNKVKSKKPGETGVLALDWWNGNKTPYVNSDVSGVLVGLTLKTKVEDIYRSLIEATAYGTRLIMERFIQSGAYVDEVIVSGGIAEKNEYLLQIFADVLKKKIKVSASEQTAALGAAMYAGAAAGKEKGGYCSIIEAAQALGKVKDKVYEPNKEYGKLYDELFEQYKQLVNKFDPSTNGIMVDLKKRRK